MSRCVIKGEAVVKRVGDGLAWVQSDPSIHVAVEVLLDDEARPFLTAHYRLGEWCTSVNAVHAYRRPGLGEKSPLTALELGMSEDDWQSRVVDYALTYQLLIWHDNDSRRNDAGFPDWVLVGPGGVAFAELKKQKGTVSAEQQTWINAVNVAPGVDAYVWRPEDWPEVQQVIKRLAGRA